MTEMIEVATADLAGQALNWARLQVASEQPRTFGCHHNGPVCILCDGMVRRWLAKELGEPVQVPKELMP